MMTTERTSSTRGGTTGAGASVRSAVLPALVAAAACVAGSALVAGSQGLWGALLGAALVFAFFGLSMVVLGATRDLDPTVTMMVALFLYVAKVIALAVAFVVVTGSGLFDGAVDRTALGVTVIVCTLVWTVCEVVNALRRRVPLYDLGEGA